MLWLLDAVLLAGQTAGAVRLKPDATAANPVRLKADTTSGQAGAQATLQKYCVTCHNDRLKTGGLTLAGVDVEHPSARAETWEKVIRKLRTGAMPPTAAPPPGKAAADALASYLEASIDRDAA